MFIIRKEKSISAVARIGVKIFVFADRMGAVEEKVHLINHKGKSFLIFAIRKAIAS